MTSPGSTRSSSGSPVREAGRRWTPAAGGCRGRLEALRTRRSPGGALGLRAAVMMGVATRNTKVFRLRTPTTSDAYSATGNAHAGRGGRMRTCSGCAVLRSRSTRRARRPGDHSPGLPEPAAARERTSPWPAGVSLILRKPTGPMRCQMNMLSRAANASFDSRRRFRPRRGCGIVVLKRLTDAIRDGNQRAGRWSAVPRSTRDGGPTADRAQHPGAGRRHHPCAARRCPPRSVNLDRGARHRNRPGRSDRVPTRWRLGPRPRRGPCALGAVRDPNIGHLWGAAGVAAIKNRADGPATARSRPTWNFDPWNPAIDPSGAHRLFVPTEGGRTGRSEARAPWRCRRSASRHGTPIVVKAGPEYAPRCPPYWHPPSPAGVLGRDRDASRPPLRRRSATGSRATAPRNRWPDVARAVNLSPQPLRAIATVRARDHAEVAGLGTLAEARPARHVAAHEQETGPNRVPVLRPGRAMGRNGRGTARPPNRRFLKAIDELEPDLHRQVGFSLRMS